MKSAMSKLGALKTSAEENRADGGRPGSASRSLPFFGRKKGPKTNRGGEARPSTAELKSESRPSLRNDAQALVSSNANQRRRVDQSGENAASAMNWDWAALGNDFVASNVKETETQDSSRGGEGDKRMAEPSATEADPRSAQILHEMIQHRRQLLSLVQECRLAAEGRVSNGCGEEYPTDHELARIEEYGTPHFGMEVHAIPNEGGGGKYLTYLPATIVDAEEKRGGRYNLVLEYANGKREPKVHSSTSRDIFEFLPDELLPDELLSGDAEGVDAASLSNAPEFEPKTASIGSNLRAKFVEGAKVLARWKGHVEWHPGKIVRVRQPLEGDNVYDILYDDGDEESDVVAKFVALDGECGTTVEFCKGDDVEAQYEGQDKKYSRGTVAGFILSAAGDTLYDIDYEDGTTDRGLGAEHIREKRGSKQEEEDESAFSPGGKKEEEEEEEGSVEVILDEDDLKVIAPVTKPAEVSEPKTGKRVTTTVQQKKAPKSKKGGLANSKSETEVATESNEAQKKLRYFEHSALESAKFAWLAKRGELAVELATIADKKMKGKSVEDIMANRRVFWMEFTSEEGKEGTESIRKAFEEAASNAARSIAEFAKAKANGDEWLETYLMTDLKEKWGLVL
ncbi:hypothetical protein ACHAXT_012468 [Thalassiosira profunda]